MFSMLETFLNRHKRTFIVSSVVIGGSAMAINYADTKLREWQKRETLNFLETSRKKQYFESTERICNHMILSLAPSVCEAVTKSFDTQEILNVLRGNPENKTELWENLKMLTFAKITSLVYAFTILVVTLRIQSNIMGSYLYIDSIKINTPVLTDDIQRQYLSLLHYFVSDGVKKLCKQIEDKLRVVLEPLPLDKMYSKKDTEELVCSLQTALCSDSSDPLKQMITYLTEDTDTSDEDLFKQLLNKTIDLMESEEVSLLSISSVRRGLKLVEEQIAVFFKPPPQQQTSRSPVDESQIDRTNNVKLPLVKLIPIIHRLISQPVGRKLWGVTDNIIQKLITEELTTMGWDNL